MTRTLTQSTGPAHTRIYAYGAARGEHEPRVLVRAHAAQPIDELDEHARLRLSSR